MPIPSARLRVVLQDAGSNLNVWGSRLNDQALALLDEAIAGVEKITLGGDTVLTSSNYVSDQARNPVLVFQGTPSAACAVTVPNVEKWYLAVNGTLKTVTLKTAAGSGVAIEAGGTTLAYCDGTSVFSGAVTDLGGQRLRKIGTPTAATDATTKAYVDTAVATIVSTIAGDASAGLAAMVAAQAAAAAADADAADADADRIAAQAAALAAASSAATALGAAGSWTVVTASGAAPLAGRLLVDTSGGAVVLTLPASPPVGVPIQFADGADFSINNLTIARNGSTIMGLAEDMTVAVKGASFALVHSGATWRIV